MEGLGSPEATPNLDVKSRRPNYTTTLVDRNGYNIVIILVNYFSKRPFLIPYYKNIDAKEAA